MKKAINPLLLCAIVVLLSYVGPSLDDHGDEMRQSQSLSDAQKQAQAELRRDLAAAAMCRELHGESFLRYTEDGEPVCVPRKGGKVASL